MYIELMNHQTTRNCNGEKQLDGHLLNDGDMLFVSSSSNHPTYSCILDSACSYHTTLDKDLLDNYMFVNSDSFMIGNDDPCCYPFFGFPQNKIRKYKKYIKKNIRKKSKKIIGARKGCWNTKKGQNWLRFKNAKD